MILRRLIKAPIRSLVVATAAVFLFMGTSTTTAANNNNDIVSSQDAQPDKYPQDFKLKEALNYFSIESTSLLKRSMLSADFSIEETIETSDSYLDFSTQALMKEMERIEKVRDALLLKKKNSAGNAQTQTCSAEDDGNCADTTTTTTTTKKKDSKLSSEFGHFLTPDLDPGQVDIIKWDDTGSVVQEYGARVGLPPQFVPTLKEYIKEMGLLDIMQNMLYDNPLPPDGVDWFSFQSPYQKGAKDGEMRNFTWNVERPAKKWKSDMHWFNTADELSHEDALRALAKGGFDTVLKGIGEQFNLDELHVDSVGFVAVTNCDRGFIHTDWEDVDGRAFNFLVGIESPEQGGPELVVEGDDKRGETYYGSNAGILVGDGTRHGTRECDHRPYKGVRITASIYLADVTKENLSILASDTTSIFPPMEELGEEWIWAQKGRHWRKDGGGPGLVGDPGRAEFPYYKDDVKGCTKDDCEADGKRPRNSCIKTCKIFLDDATEYMPGKERREVFGY